jgi:hypothetical protein
VRPLSGRDGGTKAFDTAQSGVVRNGVIIGVGKAYDVSGEPIALEALLDDDIVVLDGRALGAAGPIGGIN